MRSAEVTATTAARPAPGARGMRRPGRRPTRLAGAALVPLLAPLLALLLVLALGGCNSIFFQPDRIRYYLPDQFGLIAEDVYFPSADGTQLTGWFLPAQGTPRGTIVYFHGNAANISNHLVQVRWLPPAGYSVFIFDYRGYGVSSGEPSREGLIQDGVAAIDYVRSRKDVNPRRLVVYAQSLGGTVGLSALARAGTAGVRAVVVESGFGSYREEARLFMDDHWFTWPFQYPVAYLFISDDHRGYDALPALARVPLLVIASTGDRTVPIEASRRLFEAFPGTDKTFWTVKGLPHVAMFVRDGSPWRPRLLAYLADKLGPPPAAGSAAQAAAPGPQVPALAGPGAR